MCYIVLPCRHSRLKILKAFLYILFQDEPIKTMYPLSVLPSTPRSMSRVGETIRIYVWEMVLVRFYRFSQNEIKVILKESIPPSFFSTALGLRTRYCYTSIVISAFPVHFQTQHIFAGDLEGLT